MFCQLLLDAQNVLRAVDAEVWFACLQQTDFKTVLQGSQLLERFRALERRGRQGGERAKHLSLIGIQPDVPLGAEQRRAGEVESRVIECGDDFHDVARMEFCVALEWACESGHIHIVRLDQPIDAFGVDERLVPLHIDDLVELFTE